jgi:hypothetical protein
MTCVIPILYFGKYAEVRKPAANANAFAVAVDNQALSSFERLKKISEENDHGRH